MGKYGIDLSGENKKLNDYVNTFEALQDVIKVKAHYDREYVKNEYMDDIDAIYEPMFEIIKKSLEEYKKTEPEYLSEKIAKNQRDKSEIDMWFSTHPNKEASENMKQLLDVDINIFNERNFNKRDFMNEFFSHAEMGSFMAFMSDKIDLNKIVENQKSNINISEDLANFYKDAKNDLESISQEAEQFDNEKVITNVEEGLKVNRLVSKEDFVKAEKSDDMSVKHQYAYYVKDLYESKFNLKNPVNKENIVDQYIKEYRKLEKSIENYKEKEKDEIIKGKYKLIYENNNGEIFSDEEVKKYKLKAEAELGLEKNQFVNMQIEEDIELDDTFQKLSKVESPKVEINLVEQPLEEIIEDPENEEIDLEAESEAEIQKQLEIINEKYNKELKETKEKREKEREERERKEKEQKEYPGIIEKIQDKDPNNEFNYRIFGFDISEFKDKDDITPFITNDEAVDLKLKFMEITTAKVNKEIGERFISVIEESAIKSVSADNDIINLRKEFSELGNNYSQEQFKEKTNELISRIYRGEIIFESQDMYHGEQKLEDNALKCTKLICRYMEYAKRTNQVPFNYDIPKTDNEFKEIARNIESINLNKSPRVAIYGAKDINTLKTYLGNCSNKKDAEKQYNNLLNDCINGKAKLNGFKKGIECSTNDLGELGAYINELMGEVNPNIKSNNYLSSEFVKKKLDSKVNGIVGAREALDKFYKQDLGVRNKAAINAEKSNDMSLYNLKNDARNTLLRLKQIQSTRPWHYWLTSWKADSAEKSAIKEMENYLKQNLGFKDNDLKLEYTTTSKRSGKKFKHTNVPDNSIDKINLLAQEMNGNNTEILKEEYATRKEKRNDILNPKIVGEDIDNANVFKEMIDDMKEEKQSPEFLNKLKKSVGPEINTKIENKKEVIKEPEKEKVVGK